MMRSGVVYPLRRREPPKVGPASSFWPTPMAHEARLGYQRRDTGKKGSQKSLTTIVIDEAGGRDAVSGQLSPVWEEALMGFPLGWTDPEGTRLVKRTYPEDWSSGEWEKGIPRLTEKKEWRSARVGALGNAVVPPQATVIARWLLEAIDEEANQ